MSDENNNDHGLSKYRAEYCEMLVKHMAGGNSFMTFGVDIDVSSVTLHAWVKKHPEWAEAKRKGYAAGLKFFEQLLTSASVGILPDKLKQLNSSGINMTAVIFALKTRFHKEYGEINKVDHTSSDGSLEVGFVAPKKEPEAAEVAAKIMSEPNPDDKTT